MKILVSACLLGENCKYNGGNNYNAAVAEFVKDKDVLPILVGSPCSPRDSQESSPTPQFKSINSSALSLLYGPILIHDYRKNHSFA